MAPAPAACACLEAQAKNHCSAAAARGANKTPAQVAEAQPLRYGRHTFRSVESDSIPGG
jgi:hypothetical protein